MSIADGHYLVFPVLLLGIFWQRATREGAIARMVSGLGFTSLMILLMQTPQILRFLNLERPSLDDFLGVNAQGIGTVGMILNFVVMVRSACERRRLRVTCRRWWRRFAIRACGRMPSRN